MAKPKNKMLITKINVVKILPKSVILPLPSQGFAESPAKLAETDEKSRIDSAASVTAIAVHADPCVR
jgi:hypothetical protein